MLTVLSIICSHLWDDALSSNSLLPQQYFTGLECGHKFCMQCWGDYLTTKIIEEGMGQVHTNVSKGVGSLWGFGLFSGWCSAFFSFLLRPFRAPLIVVTFWLMTTQSCEYLRGTKFQFLNHTHLSGVLVHWPLGLKLHNLFQKTSRYSWTLSNLLHCIGLSLVFVMNVCDHWLTIRS